MKVTNDKQLQELYSGLAPQINLFVRTNKQINVNEFACEKFDRVLQCHYENKKGKKPKNQLAVPTELINKVITYNIKELDAHFLMVMRPTGMLESCIMYRIKTTKGSIYLMPAHDKDLICYTAHFFDRYKQRINDNKIKTRSDAIKHFMKSNICQDNLKAYVKTKSNELVLQMNNGIGLGIPLNPIALITTFISNNMLNDKQKVIINCLKTQSPGNNF